MQFEDPRGDEVVDALQRLDVAGDAEHARRAAIAHAEPIVLAAMGEARWELVIDLAAALSDAYAPGDDRRREWAVVALDAARSLEGEWAGPSTVAALERLGRVEHERDDLESAEATLLEALELAERVYEPDAPALYPILVELAGALLAAERAAESVPYAERAVELAEAGPLAEDEAQSDEAGDDEEAWAVDGVAHGLLAEALLAIDRVQDARATLERVEFASEPWLAQLHARASAAHEQVTRRLRPLEQRRS